MSPTVLFISALYPASFLHFDFSFFSCPPCSVFCTPYVYFKDAWQAFYVNCSPTARTFQIFFTALFFSPLFSFLPPQLVRELLHEGQTISVGVSAESGRGGQWLARIRQLIKEGSVPDVSLVPVGISYDCVPKANVQVGVRVRTHTCKHTHLIRAICNCNVPRSK